MPFRRSGHSSLSATSPSGRDHLRGQVAPVPICARRSLLLRPLAHEPRSKSFDYPILEPPARASSSRHLQVDHPSPVGSARAMRRSVDGDQFPRIGTGSRTTSATPGHPLSPRAQFGCSYDQGRAPALPLALHGPVPFTTLSHDHRKLSQREVRQRVQLGRLLYSRGRPAQAPPRGKVHRGTQSARSPPSRGGGPIASTASPPTTCAPTASTSSTPMRPRTSSPLRSRRQGKIVDDATRPYVFNMERGWTSVVKADQVLAEFPSPRPARRSIPAALTAPKRLADLALRSTARSSPSRPARPRTSELGDLAEAGRP